MNARQRFHVVLIRPTRYGRDGYPVHWHKSPLPSNSLACVYALAMDCAERSVLGDDVEIVVHAVDETNCPARPKKLIEMIERDGGRALVGFTGIQTNQYPRTMDLARPFRDAGIPVAIGGFHVSGCMSMLDKLPPELQDALDLGISLFAGELEGGRLDGILKSAWDGDLEPVYDTMDALPSLENEPVPYLPAKILQRTLSGCASFDLGRGCPYKCSFCCIINVQGRKGRNRNADDLERIVRHNHAIGIDTFFLTDDNFARNRDWEACMDRLIKLGEEEGIKVDLQIQVDVLCHKIPRFIEKCARAGVGQAFIGLENINSDNLSAAGKGQNKITDYREMLLAWKRNNVVVICGYIIGFPNDTRQSILRDIEVVKRELPIDMLSISNLTPLPGSQDHKELLSQGIWMDPDLNKYDLSQRVTHHPRMSDEEWDEVYWEAMRAFYTPEHMRTILLRTAAVGSNKKYTVAYRLAFYGVLPFVHKLASLDMGLFRRRFRTDRRSTYPIENPLIFYPRNTWNMLHAFARTTWAFLSLRHQARKIWSDPRKLEYTDLAISEPEQDDLDNLDLYNETRGGTDAVAKLRRHEAIRERVKVTRQLEKEAAVAADAVR